MKKIFNKCLYAEGLRRTRMMTVIFTAVLILGLFAFVTGSVGPDTITDSAPGGHAVSAPFIAVWFALIVMIAAPTVTFRLFSFLSGRSESDFYHSLPYSRTTVFLSYTAALITQFAVMLASAGAALGAVKGVFYVIIVATAAVIIACAFPDTPAGQAVGYSKIVGLIPSVI